MTIVEQIGTIPLFEGLARKYLEDLAMIVTEQGVSRGQAIFSEGEEGTGIYVMSSGRVKIFKLSWEGKEQILHIFGPGEPFGEVPVFAGQRFPANAEAMDDGRILFFPRNAFIDLIRKNPDLALNMLSMLSMRLRRFTALIEDLSLKEVPGRLAAYLLYLSERESGATHLELDISKGQLASLLGTIPETLSRVLGRMKDQGLIEVRGPIIRIHDLEALRDLTETGGRL